MGEKIFKGRFNLDTLNPTDRVIVSGALAVLERLDESGLITFEIGVSRARHNPDEIRTKPATLQPQRRAILDFINERAPQWVTAREVVDGLSISENSIGAQLTLLRRQHFLEVKLIPKKGDPSTGRKMIQGYRVLPCPVDVRV